MTWTMKSCLVILSILVLWQLQEVTEACSCINTTPQQALCKSDVVLKARVTGKHEVDQNGMKSIKFDIKVLKVFKGPQVNAVYTSGPCRVLLDTNGGKQYLITGQLDADGKVHIILCNYIKLWEDLTATERSLVQDNKHYCG